MESYSVEAVLSAVDKGFSSSMRGAERSLGGLQSAAGKSTASIGKIATGIGVFKAVSAAGSFVTNAISGLSGELAQGSKTWKTYTGNMENLGKSKKEISSVKKELMDYATQTIYSASDMATTYSQLTAVGIKGSNQLVKGFGGLAAAAENPKQAMKTLSQQATQMAAKPTVQWQDFKLMLEQTPAGIAAVAKEMGMSTAEMVKSVQDGTIKTEDFFNAVKKVGTNKAFSKMATQYKSVDEAMDGLQETITNKLQPAYDKFSQFAIDGIEKVIEVVDKLNFDKWIGDINSVDDLVQKVMPTLVKFGSVLGAGILASGSAPFLEKMPSIFSSMADKGGLAAKSIGDIAGRAKELSGKANLTNFAKGFETARSKLGGFKIGMLDVGEVFDNVDNTILNTSSKLISLGNEFPKLGKAASIAGKSFGGISTGLETATSVGTTVLSGFMSSITSVVGIALKLIAPAAIIGVVLAGFGLAMDQFGTQINSFIQDVAVKGPQVISGFADGIISNLPRLIALGSEMVTNLLNAIAANIPTILSKGTELITTLIQGVSNALPQMIPAALNVVTALLNGIISNAPKLLMAGMNLLLSLVNGIVQNLPLIMQSAQSVIMNFVTMIVSYLPQIITIGFQILMSLINGIMQMLPALIPVAVQAIVTLINGFVSMLPMIIQMALTLVQTLLEGLVANLPMILEGAVQIIQALVQGLVGALPQIITMGIQIIFMLVSSILQMLPSVLSAGWEIVKSLASGIIEAVPNVLTGAWDAIKSGFGNLWDTITGKSKETSTKTANDMQTATTSMQTSLDTFANGATTSLSGLNTSASGITSNLSSNVTSNFGTMASQSGAYATDLKGNVVDATNSLSKLGSVDVKTLQSNAIDSFGNMKAKGSSSVQSLEASVTSSSSKASSTATNNYNKMATGVNQSMSKINTNTTNSLNKINSTANSSMSKFNSVIRSGFNSVQSTTRSAMNSVSNTVSSGMARAVSIAASRANSLASVFRGLHGSMYSSGVYAMSGLASGINAGAGSAIAAANSVANRVASTINRALKIHSPSRVTEESGEFTTEGLEVGMLNRLRNVANAARSVAQTVTDNLSMQSRFDSELAFSGSPYNLNLNTSRNRVDQNVSDMNTRPIRITLISELDGRVIAQGTTPYIDAEMQKRNIRLSRLSGDR